MSFYFSKMSFYIFDEFRFMYLGKFVSYIFWNISLYIYTNVVFIYGCFDLYMSVSFYIFLFRCIYFCFVLYMAISAYKNRFEIIYLKYTLYKWT